MKNSVSYIGQFIEDDGREIFDRSYNRSAQDFIIRVDEGGERLKTLYARPKLDSKIVRIINQAIKMSYLEGIPWSGKINDIQIQIHSRIINIGKF